MKNKRSNQRSTENIVEKNVLLIEISHNQELLYKLLDILDQYHKDLKIYVSDDSNFIDCTQNIELIHKKSKIYKKILRVAHYLIVDSDFSMNFMLKKEQIFLHLATETNEKNLLNLQKLCRLSTYNIMKSEEEAHDFLSDIGIHHALKKECVLVDYNQNPQKIIELFFEKKDIQLYNHSENKNVFIYMSQLNNKHQECLLNDYLKKIDEKTNNYFIVSPDIRLYHALKLSCPDAGFVLYPKKRYSIKEKILLKLSLKSKLLEKILSKKTNSILKKTSFKNLKGFKIDKIIDFLDTEQYACRELALLKCQKEYIDIPSDYVGIKIMSRWYKNNINFKKKHYQLSMTLSQLAVYENEKGIFYNSSVQFIRWCSRINKTKSSMRVIIYLKIKSLHDFPIHQCKVFFNDQHINAQFKQGVFCHRLTIDLSDEITLSLPAQNKIYVQWIDENGLGFKKDIYYKKDGKNRYLKSKIMNIDDKTCCYLRQSLKNRVYLTIRPQNKTDLFIEDLKINLAYYLSFLLKKKKIYILYEKDSSRYEESASVLYETLINQGYHNAYFILDKNYQDHDKIEDKYLKNIINKYSFKHYLYFFVSQTFLGSELLVHAMELRIMNKHVLQKINSDAIDYVFLQHGVMYMISLDSDSRKFFTPRQDGKGKFRVVTSSQKEADHFIQLGGYQPEQVIICGLPKYDRNVLYSQADKIVIMLTWRPWEYNQATTDFRMTKYYQMLERIVEGIGEELRKYLIILPHPLFYKAAMENEFELKKYMMFNVKYDEILRQTRVLITDYSSIAYDAFYRGSRVIFYWEELQESLQNYGAHTKLMLNEENVFGDICYNNDELRNIIENNYHYSQLDSYIQRYNSLVEFHDGHNTERLIYYLKSEKIL